MYLSSILPVSALGLLLYNVLEYGGAAVVLGRVPLNVRALVVVVGDFHVARLV